jgi:hypothetical protein
MSRARNALTALMAVAGVAIGCGTASELSTQRPDAGADAAGASCLGGAVKCGNACVSIMATDPTNCGGCSVVCATGQACSAGACTSVCDGGPSKCDTPWTVQSSGTKEWLHSVYFTSGTEGYCVGDSGTILKTSNGGTTWAPQVSGTTNQLRGEGEG